MPDSRLLAASCRMALAGLLHDLGKFAERARIDVPGDRLEGHEHLYCPFRKDGGFHTHKHAAWSALAFDRIEGHLLAARGEDVFPFAGWKSADADDSLINAAARHHTPDTFLQWIVATADRVASGFERESFAGYNLAADETTQKKNHYTARLMPLLEQVRLDGAPATVPTHRYRLSALSPAALFPVPAKGYEQDDREVAKAEYMALWQQFEAGLAAIPASHRASPALWLDHFESLWLAYTHAIPSATAFGAKPDVSLYDHSKAVAALAVALWRYHHDRGDDSVAVRDRLADQRSDWDEEKFLLVQGDFFGIQDFIFASGGATQKRAAKLLRGRSFQVSLLTECAALKVLEALALPASSQIVNAAGKFLIVAPNTADARARLATVQQDLDAWFLERTFGQSGIGLAWMPARCNDFRRATANEEAPFNRLMTRLFAQLERGKLRRFDICGDATPGPVFAGFLERFGGRRECEIDGRSPAETDVHGLRLSLLAADQLSIGAHLANPRTSRLLISRETLGHAGDLRLSVFGFHISFTGTEEATGRFGPAAADGRLLRAWDFSLPEAETAPLWNGYARRAINAWVPIFGEVSAWDRDRYRGTAEEEEAEPGAPKTLNHLACEDRRMGADGRWEGIAALMTVKGDVDNLGLVFQQGMGELTFAKMAALSRQVNAFFAVWLPWRCRRDFPDTYTVFAGGDDFFLIGAWHSQIELARGMRADFARYVAGNPALSFCAGLAITKPGLPIHQLADAADDALAAAKALRPEKNAVTCFGHSLAWPGFDALEALRARLEELASQYRLSTGYVYGLLTLADMAGKLAERPENAIWHSYFAYRTRRFVVDKIRNASEAERQRILLELAQAIAADGIEKFGAAYKVALFHHLYLHRD